MADAPVTAWFEELCTLVELLGRVVVLCLQLLWLVLKGVGQLLSGEG